MKHLKLFFALFAMLALGVGNAWGAEATINFSEKGLENGVQYLDPFTIDANTTITFAGGGNDGKYYDTGTGIRTYGDGTITVECTNGTISEISFTWSGTSYKPAADVASPAGYSTSTGKWTGSASSVTLTRPSGSGNWRLQQVTVTYETAGGGEPTPSLTTDPTTIDFGTVYEGATVADKTVAVNFANLTGAVTYSGLSTPFSATGAIAATGDKITISADASTIGEYSQTLTVASTADSKTAEVTVKMNVVEKPAPTGTFTLHTGELIEGDYVIYYSGKAMKAEVASNRLQYVEVTPSNNEIVDPAAAAIWHIAKSGANWTVYNNNKGYAAGTGTKSQAGLVANLTGDNANKAAWTVTASGNAYEFVNVWNKGESVNANLRNNGTYGFACYATSTGGALSLYRKAGTKYNVTVSSTTNGSVTADPTSAEAGATIALTVTPAAGYILDALTVTDASSNTIEVADNKFTMPASNVTVSATFKVNEAPDAVLQLMANGEEVANDTHKVGYVATLPTTIENDCAKTFVGWSENENCTTEPEYAPGAEFTLTKTEHLLYAVYANVEGGEIFTTDNLFNTTNGSFNSTAGIIAWSLDGVVSILQAKDNASSAVADYVDAPRWYKDHLITITPAANITEIAVKAQSNDYATALANSTYTNATATVNGDIVTITPSSANEVVTIKMGAQARLSTLIVTYRSIATYSNYSTTCSAALTAPTFSLAEDTYTEAQEVTLFAEEGTIYYTLDGTTPDAESTEYTEPIVLAECGTTTIKAIAISGENSSPVTSATYTIKLPLNNSQANPYTEAEAIEVYNGGCYDNQEVYVMGVVETAQFYNSNTYTITLEGGFKFFKFYEAAGNTPFTEAYIQRGDTLVACGKLVKYGETYELGEGCYLVDRKAYSAPKVDISNTPETAYTVEKAIELIDDITSDLTKQVYVKGTVSEIVTEYNATYGNITYNISSDGSTSSPQFQLYRGKSYDGENFTSADDIKVGDKVVVYGEMKKHYSTYEMNEGNQLVALEREDTTTGVDNVETTVAAKKAIINGQLVIVKDGVMFNALGQVIK